MAYELVENSVTSGLVIEISKIFPAAQVARETLPAQFIRYPHWFINQLTISTQAERRNHWFVDYLATARFHVAADPALVVGSLQQQLDAVGIKILSELEYIYFGDMPVRITQPRVEKVDGVLHWFGNISVMATKPMEPDPLQETLETNIATA